MKKNILLLTCIFACSMNLNLHAQQLQVNKGDKYEITSVLSSSTAIKRNQKQIDLTAVSSLTKQYEILDANNEGYRIKITNTKIADTIKSLGNDIIFNSNRPANPGSEIETSLSQLVNATHTLSLDKTGKITKVDDETKALQHAEIAENAHVYHKDLVVDAFLNFGSTIQLPENAKIGLKWNKEEGSIKNAFAIKEMDAKTTTISYSSEENTDASIMLLNGIVVLDNASGVVLKRVNKVSQQSLLSNGDKTFRHASNYTLAEVCNKIN